MSSSSIMDVFGNVETGIFQMAYIRANGQSDALGNPSNAASGVVGFPPGNRSDEFQRWIIMNDNATDPNWPYLIQLRSTRLYLDTWCDLTNTGETRCSDGTATRAYLKSVQNTANIPDTGRWRAELTDQNDGTFRWYQKSNGTSAFLSASGNAVFMNRSTPASNDGRWTLVRVGEVAATASASASPTTATNNTTAQQTEPASNIPVSSRLSDGAIAGIAIGVALAILGIAIMAVVFCLRKRRRNRMRAPTSDPNWIPSHQQLGDQPHMRQTSNVYMDQSELDAVQPSRKDGYISVNPQEFYTPVLIAKDKTQNNHVVELPGTPQRSDR